MTSALLSADDCARLNQISRDELISIAPRRDRLQSGDIWRNPLATDHARHFEYVDAVLIETARQLCGDSLLSLGGALQMVAYAGLNREIGDILNTPRADDYFVAIGTLQGDDRSTSSSISVSDSVADTGLFWARGALAEISSEIDERMREDREIGYDCDVSRVILANVSAAERRLRKRAAALGINLD